MTITTLPAALRRRRRLGLPPAILALVAAGALSGSAGAAPQAGAAGAAPAAPARTFTLKIDRGSGGGEYRATSLVHIWADPAPAGSVFDRWTGDLEPLIDRYAPHTTLVMPSSGLSVAAAYKRAVACAPQTETIDGAAVTYCAPPAHTAVILLFHGFEGTGASFFRSVEQRLFAADAAAAGYALVALDSADRERKTWSLQAAAENPDVRHVRAVLQALRQRRLLGGAEPIYALGVLGGGFFAARLAPLLPCKAAAIFLTAANLPPGYQVPTIWLMAQNQMNRQPRALAEYTALSRRGVAAKFDINDPSPVYPLRFWRIQGVTPDDSRAIHRLLREKGVLDAHDLLAQNPESSGWETMLPPPFLKLRGPLREQLDVCFALPRFYSDFDHRILDFFDEHR